MKVQCRLQGEFHRLPLNATDTIPVSLADLINEVQAVATQHRRRSPDLLRQSFGLDFLPKSVLIKLLQQSQGVSRESELYQIPSLQLLHPITSNLTSQVANTYRYQFVCPEGTFNLTPDNPQIPFFSSRHLEQSGFYTVELSQPDYPGLSNEVAKNIWQHALEQWQALTENQIINLALTSLDLNNFSLINHHEYYTKNWISLQELPLYLRETISFLRLGENELSILSAPAKLLIQQYQS
ncbi:MAG: hypothetical protein H0X31_20925, partial [Nostocaceae cyanobacterium]|nr:hypothetical protein [Nostocaceae cyanobacterium]